MEEEEDGKNVSSLLTILFPVLHSLVTSALLRQSGKSNSMTTTNEIIANGETPLVALSMNANPMRHAVLCGSTKRCSTEDGRSGHCWTIFKKKIYF